MLIFSVSFLLWSGGLQKFHHTKGGFLGPTFFKVPFGELPDKNKVAWFENQGSSVYLVSSRALGGNLERGTDCRGEACGVEGRVEVPSVSEVPTPKPALGPGQEEATRGHTEPTAANRTSHLSAAPPTALV